MEWWLHPLLPLMHQPSQWMLRFQRCLPWLLLAPLRRTSTAQWHSVGRMPRNAWVRPVSLRMPLRMSQWPCTWEMTQIPTVAWRCQNDWSRGLGGFARNGEIFVGTMPPTVAPVNPGPVTRLQWCPHMVGPWSMANGSRRDRSPSTIVIAGHRQRARH